jgi:hypothetical protein
MAKYLGETPVDVKTHPEFKNYTPADWAMYFIERFGQIDGGHHKQWVLDQVARILKGTPVEVRLAKWADGHEEYRVSTAETPSKEYLKWVEEMKGELDGDEYEYDYDEGTAP